MIKKLAIYLFNLPLYYLMAIFPEKKNLWIFGAWFSEKYFDNPRFLFEYIKDNSNDIQVIWITKDKKLCNSKDIIYKYSFKAIYFSLIAEVFVVSHSTLSDLFIFINNNSRKVIQLWHGIPIKKIGMDDLRIEKSIYKEKIKYIIFPFLKENYSLVISSSEEDLQNMKTAFNTEKVLITGYPRNDIFIKVESTKKKKYKVLYAPTLRDNIDDEINLFDDFGFDNEIVLNFLKSNEVYLDIKMHPANKIDSKFKNSIQCKYINFLESKIEINEIIREYSIIISDYSGIYVDYLLTNKPIIFAPFDYEKYIKKDRELYYDYDEVTPGPKCKNWKEVLDWIIKLKENPELYKDERKRVKKRFHKFVDGKNCERVFKEIIKLTGK